LAWNVARGRVHLREFWTADGSFEGDMAAYTVARRAYRHEDPVVVVMLKLRSSDPERYHDTFVDPDALFLTLLHECAHYVEDAAGAAVDDHGPAFYEACRLCLSVYPGWEERYLEAYGHATRPAVTERSVDALLDAWQREDAARFEHGFAALFSAHVGAPQLLTAEEVETRLASDDAYRTRAQKRTLIQALRRLLL
jgi:hypothetical protein